MTALLGSLALLFGHLGLLAFGGGNTILPEMERQVVDVHHWMTAHDFGALFALAQTAPGPNMMIVVLVGWSVAGGPGALVAALAAFIPTAALALATLHLWHRFRDRPWRRRVQEGLVPVTVGFVAASAVLIVKGAATSPGFAFITGVSALLAVKTKVHPLVLLAFGAGVGWFGVGR
ncbi:chromate transporter [Verrucomicrobium sp. GAS474]|uniref:chromate transporter n=1 Tax=Verrucomicrobium sp. GAS474 TaxID=1882831 RepID=UPI00087B9FDD|nr:chromate transporter [Verrucomicrobium sp. GAS474]SDT90199.1 chromate transporter [Verrucomicrobium sp. GAS474]